jgi:tRNA-specific 2-thiouridylase
MFKTEVIEMAGAIPEFAEISAQRESTEICFVENDYTDILKKHMDVDMEGEVVDLSGNVVGVHRGYAHYTIGKRRGFTVRGAHDPHYVLALQPERNRIVVGTKEKLAAERFAIKDINMFEELNDFECRVKVRYRTSAVAAHVRIRGDEGEVMLHEPVYGLARGQFAVFYDGERVIGSGVIGSSVF